MKRRRRFTAFHYRDCDAFAEYLHQQSLHGLHFKEFRMGMVFECGEPADIDYAVEVFPMGTEMDTRPEASTEEYAEYCEAAGWTLIDSSRKFCIFRRTKEDAVPIVEPEERFANIRKAEWLLWLSQAVPVFLLSAVSLVQLISGSFDRWIFSNPMLLVLLFIPLACAERILEGARLLAWSVTRRNMIRAGIIPTYGRKKHRPFKILLPSVLFLVSAVFVFLSDYQEEERLLYLLPISAWIMILLITAWISFWRPSRSNNQMFQILTGAGIGFCFTIIMTAVILGVADSSEPAPENAEDFPLIQADYRQMDGMITSAYAEHMESILGSVSRYYVDYTAADLKNADPPGGDATDSLRYTLYQSRHPWILDKLWKEEMSGANGSFQDRTRVWNAVYAVSQTNEYGVCRELVRCPGKIWIISSDRKLDDSQIRIIRNKLSIL